MRFRWPWQPKRLPPIVYLTPLNPGSLCDHCGRSPHMKNCPVRRVQDGRS